MKTESSLIGTKGTVGLDAKPPIDVNLTVVILPRHPKDDLSFRFAYSLNDFLFSELGILFKHWLQRFEDFTDGLVKFVFTGISIDDVLIEFG